MYIFIIFSLNTNNQIMYKLSIIYQNKSYSLQVQTHLSFIQILRKFHTECHPISNLKLSLYYQENQIKDFRNSLEILPLQNIQLTLITLPLQPILLSKYYQFYFGKQMSQFGLQIQDILNKSYSENELVKLFEQINWFFPLLNDDKFDSLRVDECKQFIRNGIIGIRIYGSYRLYLRLIGIDVKNTRCDLVMSNIDILKRNIYNEKDNIIRMLKFLIQCGFRKYAIKLRIFLREDIEYKKLTIKNQSAIKQIVGTIDERQRIKQYKYENIQQTIKEVNPLIISDYSYSQRLLNGDKIIDQDKSIYQIARNKNIYYFKQVFHQLFSTDKSNITNIRSISLYQTKIEYLIQYFLQNIPLNQKIIYSKFISSFLLKIKLHQLHKKLLHNDLIVIPS